MSATLATSKPRRQLLLYLFSIFVLLGAASLFNAASAAAAVTTCASGDTLGVTSSVDSASPAKTAKDGASVTMTVTALKSGGGTDTACTDSITLTSSRGDTITAGTGPLVSGVETFNVTIDGVKAGSFVASDTFTATDNATATTDTSPINPPIPATEALTVAPGAATQLVLASSDDTAGTAVDGATVTFTATVEDADGAPSPPMSRPSNLRAA